MRQFKEPLGDIITHDGIFHFDEVFAIALLAYYRYENTRVFRTRDEGALHEAKINKNIWVVDVGGTYDYKMRNFDHHHDDKLSCSAKLILDDLVSADLIPRKYFHALNLVCEYATDIDTNFRGLHSKIRNFTEEHKVDIIPLHSLVNSYNRMTEGVKRQYEMFGKVLAILKQYIQNIEYKIDMEIASERAWEDRKEITESTVFFTSFIMNWKKLAIDYNFAIFPNSTNDGWVLQAKDSDVLPIPDAVKDAPGCKFLHANKFIAIFDKAENAIVAAKTYC